MWSRTLRWALGRPGGRLAVLVILALLVLWRAPVLVSEPRLLAEEASVYLVYALGHGPLATLLLVPTSQGPAGYLHLAANLTAVLQADVFPLEDAAAVGLVAALVLQMVPFVVVLWVRSPLWEEPRHRALVLGLLLLAPPISPAVWLSVTNAQVFCGLASLVVLLGEPEREGRGRWRQRCLLLFNGLSGLYTGLLAPAFWLRALRVRKREEVVQAGLVTATALTQGALYALTVAGAAGVPERWREAPASAVLSALLLFHVFGAFLAGRTVDALADRWQLSVSGAGSMPLGLLVVSALVLVLVVVWLVRMARGWRLPALLVALATTSGVVGLAAFGLPRGRYAVLPGMLVLFVLWAARQDAQRRGVRHLLTAVLGAALLVGALTYRLDAPARFGDRVATYFGEAPGRPDWRAEVAQWRRDPRRVVRVWPFSGDRAWRLYLPRELDFERVVLSPPVEEWRLLVHDETVQREGDIHDAPGDYRVVVAGSVQGPVGGIELELRRGGEPTAAVLGRVEPELRGGDFIASLTPHHLAADDVAGDIRLVMRARPGGGVARIVLREVEVVPRVMGLADEWPRKPAR